MPLALLLALHSLMCFSAAISLNFLLQFGHYFLSSYYSAKFSITAPPLAAFIAFLNYSDFYLHLVFLAFSPPVGFEAFIAFTLSSIEDFGGGALFMDGSLF